MFLIKDHCQADNNISYFKAALRKLLFASIIFTVAGQAFGRGNINTERNSSTNTKSDVPVFEKLLHDFTVTSNYLVIPIKNGVRKCELVVSNNGKPVWHYNTELAVNPEDVDWYAFFTLEQYKGKPVTVSVNQAAKEGFDLIRQADTVPGSETWYKEPYRPQFHFSQKVGWNNDGNGMVYYDGEYHLFFQHNPVGVKWDNMTWGHAISKDLVHWQQQSDKLFPRTMAQAMCFSGSAAVDKKNTSGLKNGDEDVIVAFLTDTGAGESLAYSNDRGRTFTWYEGNPVVKHRGRDPKVIWYAYDKQAQPLNDTAGKLGGHWVMAVYDENAGRNIAFYTSTDLKNWTEQSHLTGFFECPEIFKLPVDGNAQNTRWVVTAADAQYVIGSFDGKTFTPEHEGKYRVHYGNYYAAQTFSDVPDGRRIQIGWAKIDMPGMPFNQTFSFPHELTLRTSTDGVRLFAEPVKEIEKLYSKTQKLQNKPLIKDQPAGIDTADQMFDIRAAFDIGSAEQAGLQIGSERVIYDAKSHKLDQADMNPVNGQVTIRVLVDRPMIEIIGNDGRVYITKPRNPGEVSAIQAFATGGDAKLIKLEVHELNSIWR